ncbi:MAG: cation:proton antiporter [Chloroflexota bacterium]
MCGFIVCRGSQVLIDDRLIETTVAVVAAYGTYLIADHFHESGVIATLVAGVINRQLRPARGHDRAHPDRGPRGLEFIGFLLTAVVFLLVGLAIR